MNKVLSILCGAMAVVLLNGCCMQLDPKPQPRIQEIVEKHQQQINRAEELNILCGKAWVPVYIKGQEGVDGKNAITLPPECDIRVSIEAASTFGWHRFVGSEGLAIGLDTFGASAPYKKLAEEFGFTPEAVAARIVEHFSGDSCGCDCGSCGGCH